MRIALLTHRYSRTGAVGLQHLLAQGIDVAAVITPVVRYKSGGLVGSVLQLVRRRGIRFSAQAIGRVLVCMVRGAVAQFPGAGSLMGEPWGIDEVPLPPTVPRLSPPDVNDAAFVRSIAALHADLLV